MTFIQQYTQQYLSLFSGILLMSLLFLTASDVLFNAGVFEKNDPTVIELCKDEKKHPADETGEQEFTEEGGDGYTEKPVVFCFDYVNRMIARIEPAPAMNQGVYEVHLPPPKLILI